MIPFSFFYRGVIEAPNPWNYHIVLDCEEGKAFPRYFECTPTKKGTYPLTMARPEYCQLVVKEAKVLVDMLKEAFPDIVVRILNIPPASLHGGCGWNYGAAKPLSDGPSILYYQKELSLAYEKWTEEEGYRNFMEYIDLAGQFDADYNFPHIMRPVNTRNTATERIDTNAVHPTYEGYMQVADAVFRNAVHSFCTEA